MSLFADNHTEIVSNGVVHDAKRGRYVETLTIERDEPFKIQVSELQTSAKNGYPTIYITREPYFRFMSLPPELRNMIYANLFPDFYIGDDCEVTAEDFFEEDNLAITRVSRQLRREVLPVLLANRFFCFEDPDRLHQFICHLDHHRLYLTHLDMGYYQGEEDGSRLFDALKECPYLQSLGILLRGSEESWGEELEGLYADARSWIIHVALARGKKQAALEILDPDFIEIEDSDFSSIAFKGVFKTYIDRDPVLEGWMSVRR